MTADDGVRLSVDAKRVIDDWTRHAAHASRGSVVLHAGQTHRIELEYFEATGLASVKLEGSSKRQAREVIPPSALRPPSALAGTGILRGKGRHFVDATGTEIPLRGANLGSWIVLEGWMTEFAGATDSTTRTLFTERFPGTPDAPQKLMDTYQQHFITEADFRQMRALGINLVRLPFYDRFFESDAAPGVYRPEAFALLDRTLEAAARQGVYVILDFHGAPGRAEWKRHDR